MGRRTSSGVPHLKDPRVLEIAAGKTRALSKWPFCNDGFSPAVPTLGKLVKEVEVLRLTGTVDSRLITARYPFMADAGISGLCEWQNLAHLHLKARGTSASGLRMLIENPCLEGLVLSGVMVFKASGGWDMITMSLKRSNTLKSIRFEKLLVFWQNGLPDEVDVKALETEVQAHLDSERT